MSATVKELREAIEFFKGIDIECKEDMKEAFENMSNQDDDFEVDNYRFIHTDSIDKVQQDELSNDEYILGCFTNWFIAENTDLDLEVVDALQEAEAFDALGRLMLKDIEAIQEGYASADGYGHHFNRYDGNEEEFNNYHVFRIN